MDQYLKKSVLAGAAVCLFLMPGCSPKKVRPDQEVCFIKKSTRHALAQAVDWESSNEIVDVSIEMIKAGGLTREQAVGLALHNSSALQAKFRDLGVAKADLEKAGLYKNPYLNTIIQFPHPNPFHVNNYVEVDFTWTIADLWLVPHRKKVSSDQLEIATFDIMELIGDIRMNTVNAYNKCVYAHAQLKHAHEVLERLRSVYDTAHAENENENRDRHAAFVLVNQMDISATNALFEQKKAFLELADVMGIPLTYESIILHDQLTAVEPVALVYEIAPDNPKLVKACLKIQQEKHKKLLEKVRYLEDVTVGFSFNNQPAKDIVIPGTVLGNIIAGPRLIGPTFGLSLPIFDNKYADIARAEFLIQKAENDYATAHAALKLKVELCKAEIEAIYIIINHYQNVLRSYAKIIEHENMDHDMTYAKRIAGFNTHIEWFDKKNALLKSYLQLHNVIALLEQTTGKRIAI